MSAAENVRVDGESEIFMATGVLEDLQNTDEAREARIDRAEERKRQREREEKERQEALLQKRAKALISASDLLARALNICERMGVVGEEDNLLILMLAGVSRTLPRPASVMLRGSPSSGKSSTMNAVLQLFDPEIVMERAGMSGKALFHGEGPLEGKILAFSEYHASKDSRHLIRLAQTEGSLTDESTVVQGRWRRTEITERVGRPVVVTTTSETKIPMDDLSRFQVVWADESAKQSLAVMRSRASVPPEPVDAGELQVWRKAMSLLVAEQGDFRRPPKWLRTLPASMPLERVGIRRDFERFLTFLKAIALCRGCARRPAAIDIELADYAAAYLVFESVFAAPRRAIAGDLQLTRMVARLNKQNGPVTVNELAEALGWKPAVVYKVVQSSLAQNLVVYEGGTRERNVKRLVATDPDGGSFLPHPRSILKVYPEFGGSVTLRNPYSGKEETIEVKKRGGGNINSVAPSRCTHGAQQGVCAKCAGSKK
jgi:hypothetical protein